MGELPFLVMLKVLDYLPMVDAIRYRAVCKSWRSLVDQFVLNELNVFLYRRQHSKYLQLRKCFINSNRSISIDQHFLEKLVFGNEQFARFFRNLRKFSYQQHQSCRAYQFKKSGSFKKLINTFVNLEHLYLDGTWLISIHLKKLKTFDCSLTVAPKGSKIVLDCPELQALVIDCKVTETLVLKCPKLRYLKYTQYSRWVSQLGSLEELNLWELENSEDILRNHPKLHTLNVFNVAKTVLEELVRNGRKLRRDHLKMFLRSLPVDREVLDVDQIIDYQGMNPMMNTLSCFTVKGVELYVKYEHEFRDDFFVFNDYFQGVVIARENFAILKLLTDRTRIFRKIRHAHTLHVEDLGPFNQSQLMDLMKEMPNASKFSSDNICLDQAFFDQLPTILKHLNFLTIWRPDTRDLSFLLRFRELVQFVTNGYAPSDHNTRVKAAFDKKRALDFASSNRGKPKV